MLELELDVVLNGEKPNLWAGDLLALGLFEGETVPATVKRLGGVLSGVVQQALDKGWFRGKSGETLLLPKPSRSPLGLERLLLLGLGKRDKLTLEALRAAGGSLVAQANTHRLTTLGALMPLERLGAIKTPEAITALAEGAWLAGYRFDPYQTREDGPVATCQQVWFAVRPAERERLESRVARVKRIMPGVYLARDLGNQPGNVVNPDYLATVARELGTSWNLGVTVLDEAALQAEGMQGILAVGQGSASPPRLLVLEYRGGGERPPLVVVGKAVTFDSGGISLKPGAGMEEMKFDMSGGAAVLGFMRTVAALKMPINVVGLVPTAENMPSGNAQRPGDVIKTAKGLFVEVVNTDAEGRLLLCDALHYAERFNPSAIVDLATLTGACVVALGAHACGLMGNDDALINALRQAGEASGERAWPLPLFEEYHEQIKSPIADIKNVGDKEAGAITAACFLSRFVNKGRRWAHLDIAGQMRDFSGKKPHVPKGSPGFGVRLLTHFAEDYPF